MKLTGAAILVKELIRQEVGVIFGYPGGYVLDIYDELYKNTDKIKHILPAHEQGGAHAADAYARVSGKTGVVLATGGPGATNLVTGIAAAYLDSVPVVFITGNVSVPMLGQDSFQDIDIIDCTLPIVKHSYIVKNINQLQKVIHEAFRLASSGRRGPVHIDIPKNVLLETFDYETDYIPEESHPLGIKAISPDLTQLDAALSLVLESKKPYIYCGGGVTASGSGAEIIKLSQMLGAPVGMSLMGIGSVPASFEMNLGMSGIYGKRASVKAMSEADLIIALGVRFSDRATGSAEKIAQNTSVIHIDIDPAEIGKNINPEVSLCGDLRLVLPALLDRLERKSPVINTLWLDRVKSLKQKDEKIPSSAFTPPNIISAVNNFYDKQTVVATDVGQHQMWVAQHYKFEEPFTLVTSGGLGAMGYGLGAAIGASAARGYKRTVLFTGDGSFAMNMPEMATAVTNKLPITIIVFNNSSLGMVRQLQTYFYDKHYSNTTLERKTDFPNLARAFGADGCCVNSIEDLKKALSSAPGSGPYLIECKIDIDEEVECSI